MNRITRDRLPMLLAPLIVCAAYFLGAKIGFALKLHPYPISIMLSLASNNALFDKLREP